MLGACAHNAPAPVFDATLAQRVQQGLKQSNGHHSKFAITKKSTNAGRSSLQRQRLNSSGGTAINNVPQSEPIKETSDQASTPLGQHKVKAGETLYSIAWQHSVDPIHLARINHVKSGAIYPGQLLVLKSNATFKRSSVFNKSSLVASLDREILSKSKKPSKSIQKRASAKRVVNSSSTSHANKAANLTDNSVKRWIWPVNGTVISPFSNRSGSNKGVDIAAKKGAPVRATANGKVVYSGSGLRGYGQLVIIKHNDLFLSAYAHNDKVHVKENEFVKAGQKIADLGRSGSNKEKLHFEIRYKGKPVDPLNYLPKSG